MIFDNCLIQAPDGASLSRCSKKKLKWYIDRDLAEVIDENTIRLNFEPRGRCGENDPLLLEGKPNICVVCGHGKNLTRHHIIPYCYIRHMDVAYKVDIIRDIFPLCKKCHNQYETVVQNYRRDLAEKLGIGLSGIPEEAMREVRRAMGSANAIKNHSEKIPPDALNEHWVHVRNFLGKENVTDEDLDDLCRYDVTSRSDYIDLSQVAVKAAKNYSEFAKKWRTHFVTIMKPKYMPEAWVIDRQTKTEEVWIPPRMLLQHHETTLVFED